MKNVRHQTEKDLEFGFGMGIYMPNDVILGFSQNDKQQLRTKQR